MKLFTETNKTPIMMRSNIITLLLLTALLSMNAQDSISSRALTFDEAVTLVLQNNETLRQSNIKIEQKEQESKAKTGLFLPVVSLSANAVALSDPLTLDLSPVKDAITPLYTALGNFGTFSGVPIYDNNGNIVGQYTDEKSTAIMRDEFLAGAEKLNLKDWNQTIQKQYFGSLSANFVLPIYAGGKVRIANKAAKIDLKEASAEGRQKFGEVMMELVERYYGLLLAQKVDNVRDQVMGTMKEHMDDAQKMKDEGIISNTQFLQAKVYYTEAKREKDKAKKQINIVNDALINTLTVDDKDISIMTSFFYINSLKSLEYYKQQASENSPLLEQIEHKKALVEQKIHLEKGNYMPTIAAMGTYTLAEKDLSEYMPDGMVGIGLNWTIFEGLSRNKNIKSAKLQGEQVDLYYSKSKTNIETMVTKYYNETEMHLEQIQQLETSKEFAQEYYNACEKSFKEGLSTGTEVSDANLLLAKIQIEQLQATYNYDVSLSKLLYYAGIPEQFTEYLNNGIAVK